MKSVYTAAMDYEKRFNSIRDFLATHHYLHEREVMERYPAPLVAPYHDWVTDLKRLNLDQLVRIERDYEDHFIHQLDFKQYISQCKELSEIPAIQLEEHKLTSKLKRKLTPKKIHEIQILKSFLKDFKTIDAIIDIGSGAGHLSAALVYDSDAGLKSFCLDMNEKFQRQGQKKIDFWLPELKEKITFIPFKLEDKKDLPVAYNQDKTLILGLHACGPLSTYIIKKRPSSLLNFGCCYHKLENEYNISRYAKNHPLSFSSHALTMAAKSLGTKNISDLETKFAVKRFRYPLHFMLKDNTELDFQKLGNAHPQDYQGSFKDYLEKYAPSLKKYDVPSEEVVRYYLLAGTIRALLGRLVELYIVLDRVLYLREHGLNAHVYEFFDRLISPRNLGIVVK